MLCVNACGHERNQTPLVKEPAPIDDEVSYAPCGRINDHTAKSAELDVGACEHVKRLEQRSLKSSGVQITKMPRCYLIVFHVQTQSNRRATWIDGGT